MSVSLPLPERETPSEHATRETAAPNRTKTKRETQ
jgi:hypothetical protein